MKVGVFLCARSLSSHFLCFVIAVILSFGNTGNGQFLGLTQCAKTAKEKSHFGAKIQISTQFLPCSEKIVVLTLLTIFGAKIQTEELT